MTKKNLLNSLLVTLLFSFHSINILAVDTNSEPAHHTTNSTGDTDLNYQLFSNRVLIKNDSNINFILEYKPLFNSYFKSNMNANIEILHASGGDTSSIDISIFNNSIKPSGSIAFKKENLVVFSLVILEGKPFMSFCKNSPSHIHKSYSCNLSSSDIGVISLNINAH